MIVDFVSFAQDRAEATDASEAYMESRKLPATFCNGRCNQGRLCDCAPSAASACSELLEDGVDPVASAAFWTYYAAVLAVLVVALLAAFLPA
jgi:hypothetical protein